MEEGREGGRATYQDDVQRRPKLMGDTGKEFRLGAEGSLRFQLGLLELAALHQ